LKTKEKLRKLLIKQNKYEAVTGIAKKKDCLSVMICEKYIDIDEFCEDLPCTLDGVSITVEYMSHN